MWNKALLLPAIEDEIRNADLIKRHLGGGDAIDHMSCPEVLLTKLTAQV
jgi:hypothetical protein